MNSKKAFKKLLSITTVVCMILTSVSCAFTDLSSDHWAYNAVEEMVNNNVISGYNDGTFRPDANITRAEFATILVKTLEIEEKSTAVKFKDVEGKHWAEQFIDLANPFLTGYVLNGEYYFKPDEPALREDAAVAIVSAKGLTNEAVDVNILNKFSDRNSISENIEKYVAIAVANGLMSGNANGTFNPQGNLTRAEVAALFNNIYEYEKIAIGEIVVEELPKLKVNESNMILNLGEDYGKYEVGFGSEKIQWYTPIMKSEGLNGFCIETDRDGKIHLASISQAESDLVDSSAMWIRNKENKDQKKAIIIPTYGINVNAQKADVEYYDACMPGYTTRIMVIPEDGYEYRGVKIFSRVTGKQLDIKVNEGRWQDKIGLSFRMPSEEILLEVDFEEKEEISSEIEITSSNEIQKFARNFEPGDKFIITTPNGSLEGEYWENSEIIQLDYLDNGRNAVIQMNVKKSIDSGITMYGVKVQTELIGATYKQENDNFVKLIFENNGKKYYSIADVEYNHADAQTFLNFFCYVLNNSKDVKIEIVEEEKLPDFTFDEDKLILNLGEEWEKYELSFGETRPNGWYSPLSKSKNPGALIPVRDDNKIYLGDVNVYSVAGGNVSYMYVRDKVNKDLGYVTFEIPKNSVEVKCNNAIVNYGKKMMPTSEVSVYIRVDEGYTFAGLGGLSNISESDISIKNINISRNEYQLKFKMPFKNVVIEAKTQSNNAKVIPTGLVCPRSLDVEVGDTQKLSVSVLPADAVDKSLMYTSADESIATVDNNGNVTGIKAGTTKIEIVANANPEVKGNVLVRISEPKISELSYAIVEVDDYKEKVDSTTRRYVDFLTSDGEETIECENLNQSYVSGNEDCFVEYRLIGDKLKEANLLVDVEKFSDKRHNETIEECLNSSKETKLAVDISNATKEHFQVVKAKKYDKIGFNADVENSFGILYIDENSLVFDLRDGKMDKIDVKTLMSEFANNDELFVVPFVTNNEYDANVLVIVE